MNDNRAIRSQNKQTKIFFSSILKSLFFNLKSNSTTRNHGSSAWVPGTLPGNSKYLNIRTHQDLKQGNCWANRKWHVLSCHIQADWLLPIIGRCCIHIWFQSRGFDCDRQRYNPCTHWSKWHHPFRYIYHTSRGVITLWNTVVWKIRSRFGAPPYRKW